MNLYETDFVTYRESKPIKFFRRNTQADTDIFYDYAINQSWAQDIIRDKIIIENNLNGGNENEKIKTYHTYFSCCTVSVNHRSGVRRTDSTRKHTA